jgi:copper chaperone CopZ
MKSLMLIMAFAFMQLTSIAQSEISVKTETAEFKVYGNCGMCKSRIEKSLKVDGVESAKWDKDTKMTNVVFDSDKITVDQLHQLVAEVGHDTEMIKAEDETYNKLHSCCKYERAETKNSSNQMDENHKH